MAKLKYINKNGHSSITMKLSGSEKLIGPEAAYLSKNHLNGILHVDIEGSSKLIFSGVNGIPLAQFLKQRQIVKDQFFMIAAQIIEIYKTASRFGMNMERFILDPEYIIICEGTGEIGVIYQPVMSPKLQNHGFKNFFFRLNTSLRFVSQQDFASVSGFISCIEKTPEISVENAENYIMGASPLTYTFVQRTAPVAAAVKTAPPVDQPKPVQQPSQPVIAPEPQQNHDMLADMATTYADDDDFDTPVPQTVPTVAEEEKVSEIIEESPKAGETAAQENVNEEAVSEIVEETPMTGEITSSESDSEQEAATADEKLSEAEENKPVTADEKPEEDEYISEETEIITESQPEPVQEKLPAMLSDNSATVLLSDEEPMTIYKPSLTNSKTGERTLLEKKITIVGKERARVDLCIVGNPTVSRVHAEIRKSGGSCYVVDRNSTNRTFLNGSPIPVNTEIKLSDGDIVKFSNEEFSFADR